MSPSDILVTYLEKVKQKVFNQFTDIKYTWGGNPTLAFKIFWHLFDNPGQSFTDIKDFFNIKDTTVVSRPLNELQEEGLVVKTPERKVKTPDGKVKTIRAKYLIAPRFTKQINPALSMEYVRQEHVRGNLPSLHYLHYPEWGNKVDMSMHVVYGFSEDNGVVKRLLTPVGSAFEMMRSLKALREGERRYNISLEIRNYLLCQQFAQILFDYVSLNQYIHDQEAIPEFFKELIDMSFGIGVEKDIFSSEDITDDMLSSLHQKIDEIFSLPEGENSKLGAGSLKSDDVAIFSLPSYISYKPTFNVPSELPDWAEGQLDLEYGGTFRYYKRLPAAKRILKMAKTVFFVNKSVEHKEQLPLTKYRLITTETDFTDEELELMKELVEDYWEDDPFVHALVKIIWYKGLGEIEGWKEKPPGFDRYCKRMEELKEEGARTGKWEGKLKRKFKELEDKESEDEYTAFMAMEYVMGKEILARDEERKKRMQQLAPGERIHAE